MPKTIRDYKNQFAALYSEMIAEMEVETARVTISWEIKFDECNNIKAYEPSVLITF